MLFPIADKNTVEHVPIFVAIIINKAFVNGSIFNFENVTIITVISEELWQMAVITSETIKGIKGFVFVKKLKSNN